MVVVLNIKELQKLVSEHLKAEGFESNPDEIKFGYDNWSGYSKIEYLQCDAIVDYRKDNNEK